MLGMHVEISDPIGALWLVRELKLPLYSQLYVLSQIGKSRMTIKEGGVITETYQARVRPENNITAHLVFHLKHEILSFELLSRVFAVIDARVIEDWVAAEPTGRYARRIAFLYEWLTGKHLKKPDNIGGNFVDVLDADMMVVADKGVKDYRWRVINNIAGVPSFSPIIIKTQAVQQAMGFNVKESLMRLNDEFGEDLVLRASVWITLRESRSSFAIEGEGSSSNRIERFAKVMAERVGQGELPLSDGILAQLQQEIMGKSLSIKRYGLRQSPVFVGESSLREQKEIVHYIAPPHTMVAEQLQGLLVFLEKTKNQSSIMRSAVAAFGFIYIHPLADGNGRMHRLLINDILRRDGQTPHSIILPISKAIIEDGVSHRAYNEVLDSISKMIMRSLETRYRFQGYTAYEDGVKSNLILENVTQTLPLWRYMDLSAHIVYLSGLIQKVIADDMVEESRYLKRHDEIRDNLKDIIEMSNHDANRIIRSILDNNGVRSNKLLKEYEVLADDDLWQRLVEAVRRVLGEGMR